MAGCSSIIDYMFFAYMKSNLTIPFFCILLASCFSGCNGNQFYSGNEISPVTPLVDKESASSDEPTLRKGNLEVFLLGRNGLEIEALLGVPEEKDSEDGNFLVWRYRRAVFDEATSTTYGWSHLTLKFVRGLCSNISVDLEHPPIPVDEKTEVNRNSILPGTSLFRKFQ